MKKILALFNAVLFITLAGCATEPDPLDRTQPEAVPKAIFTGTWYYNLTVTDAEYENRYTFIGEETNTYQDKNFKLRWEISKDKLNGLLLPQVYRDAEGNPVENEIGHKSIILSFPIKKHYDIRYRINPTTREELNVIEENTDRPWQEREYMEVDWSRNEATNVWNPTAVDVAANVLKRDNVAIYENVEFFTRGATPEEDTPIDTRRWNSETDPEVYVINIDTKESFSTSMADPSQLYYGSYMEPTPVRFRHSLRKAPEQDEVTYEPLEYRDEMFRRFGFFRTEYEVLDKNRYFPTETQKKYFVNRWDISGDKQIVWYLSPTFQQAVNEGDEDLKTWAQEACDTWNEVLQEASGRTDPIVVLKDNEPLLGSDGEQLTRPDGTKRWKYELGDLRYSLIHLDFKSVKAQPCGYGPSTPDADTGEIIHGTVNIYGACYQWVLNRALEYYDAAAGHCTLEDVKNGRIYNPESGKCDGGDLSTPANGPSSDKSLALEAETKGEATGQNKQQRLHFLSPALKTAYWPKADITKPLPTQLKQELAAAKPQLKKLWDQERSHPLSMNLSGFSTIAGTPYEASLIPQNNLHSLLPYASDPTSMDVLAQLSPAQRLSPENTRKWQQQLVQELSTRDDWTMFEPSIHAYVDEMKGKDRAEVVQTLRHWTYYSAFLHEMGHTIGLRHNFMGSADRRNFSPGYEKARSAYWDKVEALRSKYTEAINNGDPMAYEAYVAEVDALPATHDRFGSSSIMEYVGDWVDWGVRARPYDRAALLLGYGNKVEVKNAQGGWDVVPYQPGDFSGSEPFGPEQPSASGRTVRGYLFCSDEKIFDDAFCSPFDRGVTATEIIRNFITDSQVSYFFSNFKRDRTSFDGAQPGYYWRKWIYKYYMHAKPFAQMSINSIRYPEFWSSIFDGVNNMTLGPESRDMKPGYQRDGGEDLLRASLLYYYYLLFDVLMRPDYGHYQLKRDTSGAQYWEHTDPQYLDEQKPKTYIQPGAGWGFTDVWDLQEDPLRYYEHLQRIGVELDKLIALEVLSIPCALNTPLLYEKANGASFWNSLWTNNGSQLWKVVQGLITDNFSHQQNPWCIKCDAACQADSQKNPPILRTYPIDYLEGLGSAGFFSFYPSPKGANRCGNDSYPVQPGMDALFAIKPIFFSISGASHPWYQNSLVEKLDSQIKGGDHRFDIPEDAEVAEFKNPSGTKTYQAVQTEDNASIAYSLVDNGRRIRNRLDLYTACFKGGSTEKYLGSIGTFDRTCTEIKPCFYGDSPPEFCEKEGWDSTFALDPLKYRDLERIEAMLIMMQDMIDIAGHYAWRVPNYWQGD